MDKLKPINPKVTKAILIGVSEFDDNSFINALPIKNNVEKLAVLLQDQNILGLDEKNILILNENRRHDDILKRIDDFLESGLADTVIFYFAGHGYKSDENDFYLVTKNSRKHRIERTAIHWNDIKNTFEKGGHGIQQRLYILDACHSGAAALGENDEETQIEAGSALIAAAKADAKAYFNSTDEYTYFTEAFIHILENGVSDKDQSGLGISHLFDNLQQTLKDKNFEVTKKITEEIDRVSFFKNKGFDKLSVKRKAILGLIRKGDECLATLDFAKAEYFYLKGIRSAEPIADFEKLIEEIEAKIKKCEHIEGYKGVFEAHFSGQIAEKTQELTRQQKRINDLKDILDKKEKTIADQEKQITELKAAIEKRDKTIAALEKMLAPPAPPKSDTQNFTEKEANTAFDMIFVKGGTFKMGSNNSDYEKPVHEVSVPDYYIGKYPVTQKLWQEIMGDNPSNFKGDDNPVERVSWNDIQAFLKKLNTKTGKNYRLPTEAEWEYAARGGLNGQATKYAGSDDIGEVAWYRDNSGNKTHPVGQKKANELGLYDMSGNVWEWCQDKWHDNYEGVPTDGSAWEDGKGSYRVGRGGSWNYGAGNCRVSYRDHWIPDFMFSSLGFRLAHSSE